MSTSFLPIAFNNIADGDLMTYSSSKKSWVNSSTIPTPIDAQITNTFYISQTGSDSNTGVSPSSPLLTFQAAVDKSIDRGHLRALFAASTTPYNVNLAQLPDGFTLVCQPETFGNVDVIFSQVYDTGVVNNVVLESHPYAPYTYCDYSGTTQSIDNLSASYIRFTSGALNGQYFKAMAFQANGKLIISGNASAAVNGDTFQVRRHSVVLNMTNTYSGMGQHLIFNSLELNANGFSLLPFYCDILFHNAKLRLGGASFRPWSGGSIQFYDSFMSINTPGTFNIANNGRTVIGSDVQVNTSILCGRSSAWGFISPDILTDSNLEMTISAIHWSGADIVVGERLRIHRSLIMGSLVQTAAGSFYAIRSFIHQPSFFPAFRPSLFRSSVVTLNEMVWLYGNPSSGAVVPITFENSKVCLMENSTYGVTLTTTALFSFNVNSEIIFRTGTMTFTGTCNRIFDLANSSTAVNASTLDSSGMTCVNNILLSTIRDTFINRGTLTNFQNGSTAVLRDAIRSLNYTATVFANMLSATSNNIKIVAGEVPLNNRGVQSFAVDTALTVVHNEVIALGGSTYTLPASTLPFNGKIWKIMNSSGGSLTIQVGAAEALKIRDNSGTLVNTVTMLLGSSSTFVFLSGIYYQFN